MICKISKVEIAADGRDVYHYDEKYDVILFQWIKEVGSVVLPKGMIRCDRLPGQRVEIALDEVLCPVYMLGLKQRAGMRVMHVFSKICERVCE